MTAKTPSDSRTNAVLLIIAQTCNTLADALASTKIVLPWIMNSIGAPLFLSGLLVPIRESGSLLPQIALSHFIQRLALRKYAYAAGTLVQAIGVSLIACTAYFLKGWMAGTVIVALVGTMSLARAVCSIASKDVLGKTIPKSRRGTLMGISSSIAGSIAITVGVALVFGWFNAADDLIWLLLAATLAWMMSALLFVRIMEPNGATNGPNSVSAQILVGLGLLKSDAPFRRFVLVRTFLMSSSLSAPYFVLLAQPSNLLGNALDNGAGASGFSDAVVLGLLITLSGVASLMSGWVWGKQSDRDSRKVLRLTALMTAVLCCCAAGITLLPTQTLSSTWLSVGMLSLFFLLSITHQGVRLGRKTYIVDIADGNQRTQYVATSNSVIGLLLLIAGVVAAGLAQISIVIVLILFACMAVIAATVAHSMPPANA